MHSGAHAVRLLILLFVLFPARAFAASAESATGDARLVVVIVVDQLRADFVDRFAVHFGEGGFELLKRRGAHFVNAYFSFGSSATGPGHATIGTGRLPRQHGIVGNKWYLEPGASAVQYAVNDRRARLVGGGASKGGAPSPRTLMGPTLGDQLKMSDRRSRVFCVALKDRGSVLTGGAGADGAFWWDSSGGGFVTSDF